MTIQESAAALAGKIEQGVAAAKAEAILAAGMSASAGDASTLTAAKAYTDQKVAAVAVALSPEVQAYIDAKILELSISPEQLQEQIEAGVTAGLDGVRSRMFSEP